VNGAGLAAGAAHELEVLAGGEGSPLAPVTLSEGVARDCWIGLGTSLYQLPATPGTAYAVDATAIGGDLTVRGYGDSSFSGAPLCASQACAPESRFCVVQATGSALHVTVGEAPGPAVHRGG
jgi:hypothetical protein